MSSNYTLLQPFLLHDRPYREMDEYIAFPLMHESEGLKANAYYFSNPDWAEEYLTYCHRSEAFCSRWKAAVGDWDGKIVVDIGCGPGNIYSSLQGKPRLLIGIDVAPGSLAIAKKLGYVPVLANAESLPFVSGFADVVVLNAALHHCDDMEAVLKEAARLVKPGGLLVTDHDPQLSAWNYKGLARLLWNARLIWYRITAHGFHKNGQQQRWALASEVHHRPGHGVTADFFYNVLKPLGFRVHVFPHNHENGGEVLTGVVGRAAFKYRLGNILSYRNPDAAKSALSLMCVARRPL